MSTFPQKCDDESTNDLYSIMELTAKNETDITEILNQLITHINGGIQANAADLMFTEGSIGKVVRGHVNASKKDLQEIADRILEDITHALAEHEVSINAIEKGGGSEPPESNPKPEALPEPGPEPTEVLPVGGGVQTASPTVQVQGAGQHSITIHTHDGSGVNAITIVINVLPSPVKVIREVTQGGVQQPQADAFAQGPPIGSAENAPFNPSMFGDTAEEEAEEMDAEADVPPEPIDESKPIKIAPTEW